MDVSRKCAVTAYYVIPKGHVEKEKHFFSDINIQESAIVNMNANEETDLIRDCMRDFNV